MYICDTDNICTFITAVEMAKFINVAYYLLVRVYLFSCSWCRLCDCQCRISTTFL